MLATISNIIAAGTMLWGESQSDMPATMNADRPKPEKPRTNPANSATPIAYATTGSGPGNGDAMIIHQPRSLLRTKSQLVQRRGTGPLTGRSTLQGFDAIHERGRYAVGRIHRKKLPPKCKALVQGTPAEGVERCSRQVGKWLVHARREDHNRVGASLDHDRVARPKWHSPFELPRRRLAQQDRRAISLVGAFQTRGKVDCISDRRVSKTRARSDIADDDVAGVNPDPHRHWRGTLGSEPARQSGEAILHVHRCLQRVFGVLLIRQRRAPERHDAVADVLVDRSTVTVDHRAHRVEILAQHCDDGTRLQLLGHGREVRQVGKQQGQLALLAAQFE